MGMDLDFWRYKENAARDHAKVYRQAACEGRQLEELKTLPIDEMLKKVAAVFSDWTVQNGGMLFEKEGRGAFQIFTTPQVLRFDCYGMSEQDMNALMDVPLDFGCPLYDPQIETRFDGWTDR